MNALVPLKRGGSISTKFAGMVSGAANDMSAGIKAGFAMIGYKGKVWSIRHRGEETKLMRPDGDGPRNSIEVVVLKSASCLSKIYYPGGYVEGSTEAPACFSTNGVTPDPSSTSKQCASCAACPQNKWGSKITDAGKQSKACADSKRLAVVPLADIENKLFGGPMLLRVPAGSLSDMATFADKMQGWGYPYCSIGTRISFDTAAAHPKFEFKEIRQLSDAEADLVLAMRDGPEVSRLLAEGSELAPVQEVAGPSFEAPKPVVAEPVKQQVVTPVVTKPEPARVIPNTFTGGGFGSTETVAMPLADAQAAANEQVSAGTSFEDALDAQLEKLMPAA